MNKSNPTPPASKARPSLFHYITLAAALLGVFLLWRQQTETRQSLLEIVEQKQTLEDELKSTKAELDQLNSGDSSIQTRERLEAARKAKAAEPIKEEIETLFLQAPTVEKTAGGLTVRFGFEPDENTELPSSITLVVRIPGSANSRIVALKAVGAGSADITPVVNATGNLGIIEGSAAELDTLSFELTVTAPVKATVRGSEGIIDFEMDIAPDACTVRNL